MNSSIPPSDSITRFADFLSAAARGAALAAEVSSVLKDAFSSTFSCPAAAPSFLIFSADMSAASESPLSLRLFSSMIELAIWNIEKAATARPISGRSLAIVGNRFLNAPATPLIMLENPVNPFAPPLKLVIKGLMPPKRVPSPITFSLVAINSDVFACVSKAVIDVNAKIAPVRPERIGITPPRSSPNAEITPVRDDSPKEKADS